VVGCPVLEDEGLGGPIARFDGGERRGVVWGNLPPVRDAGKLLLTPLRSKSGILEMQSSVLLTTVSV